MSIESPNPALTRLAFLLENREARAQFRMAPTAPEEPRDTTQTMCLVPAGTTVWAHSDRGGPLELSSVAFDIRALSELLEKNLAHDVLATPRLNFRNDRIWQCASRLAQESQTQDEFTTLYCESLLLVLLIELLRLEDVPSACDQRGGLSQRQLKAATDFIEEHLGSRISLRDLARLTGLSVSHFSHAFKHTTGVPPYRWQLQARIRRAQELMAAAERPLRNVALETGFSDQAHFTRVFRRVVGVTPRVWQRARS